MNKYIGIGAALALILLAACSSSKPAMSYQERQQAAERIDPQAGQAINGFGLKLHRQMVEQGMKEGGEQANVLLSPYSVATALAITYNGSSGNTAAQMKKAMGWENGDTGRMNEASLALKKLLEGKGSGTELQIANAIWHRKEVKLHRTFLDVAKTNYGADIEALDLSGAKAPSTINKWVSKHTGGKIDKIVDKPFHANTVAVLMNAVYFNGTWTDKFSKNATRNEPFTLSDGSVRNVPMMRRTGSYAYAESAGWQAIRLPYGDERMNMLVVLPRKDSSLEELHRQLWTDASPWSSTFRKTTVDIRLPRFTAEGDKQLKEPLDRMGMVDAFSPENADFTAMANIRPLYLSSVKHKVYVEVNEEGTVAAAATAIEAGTVSAPSNPVSMTVDRPFFFAIEDAQTHVWLFVGSIVNPGGNGK